MRGRQMVFRIAILLFVPVLALAGATTRSWQDGELLSRKTVPVGRSFLNKQYVYRVHGFNCWYMVVSKTPLKLDLYVPIKFSTVHHDIVILDADGNEHKARILKKDVATHHR